MSPALLKKYLAAARDVANHIYLNADGLRFAPHPMLAGRRPRQAVRPSHLDFYHQHNTDYADYFPAAWRYKHRAALGRPRATLADDRGRGQGQRRSTWRRCGTCSKGRARRRSDRHAAGMWRALPAPGPKGEDTAAERPRGAARLHRGAAREDRAALPQPGRARRQRGAAAVHDLEERAVRDASHDVRSAAAAGRGRAAARADRRCRSRATTSSGRADAAGRQRAPAIPISSCRPASARRYEAAFARFSRVFPDMFYMEERGRHYFDRTKDRGRYLDAGFHSLMGYFRDDQPLYELILDEAQQRQLDAMWLDMDVVGTYQPDVPAVHREPDVAGRRPRPRDHAAEPERRRSSRRERAHQGDRGRVSSQRPKAASRGRSRRSASTSASSTIALRLVERAAPRGRAEAPRGAARLRAARLSAAVDAGRARRFPRLTTRRPAQDGLDHEGAMRESIVGILMSPDFLYRLDLLEHRQERRSRSPITLWPAGSATSSGRACRTTSCWRHAAAGDLHKPDVITAQARRMLQGSAHPRAGGRVRRQLARLPPLRRSIDTVDRERFPAFTNELREAMFEEPVRLLLDVFQHEPPGPRSALRQATRS